MKIRKPKEIEIEVLVDLEKKEDVLVLSITNIFLSFVVNRGTSDLSYVFGRMYIEISRKIK